MPLKFLKVKNWLFKVRPLKTVGFENRENDSCFWLTEVRYKKKFLPDEVNSFQTIFVFQSLSVIFPIGNIVGIASTLSVKILQNVVTATRILSPQRKTFPPGNRLLNINSTTCAHTNTHSCKLSAAKCMFSHIFRVVYHSIFVNVIFFFVISLYRYTCKLLDVNKFIHQLKINR